VFGTSSRNNHFEYAALLLFTQKHQPQTSVCRFGILGRTLQAASRPCSYYRPLKITAANSTMPVAAALAEGLFGLQPVSAELRRSLGVSQASWRPRFNGHYSGFAYLVLEVVLTARN
jgi:hypothetical protein